jgi:exodeoxyribonuclease VII large subunit
LEAWSARLPAPAARLAEGFRMLGLLSQRLQTPLPGMLREQRLKVENFSARLETVSYHAVLSRGFALVTNAKGEAMKKAAQISPGAALKLRFVDGEVAVKAAPVQGRLDL